MSTTCSLIRIAAATALLSFPTGGLAAPRPAEGGSSARLAQMCDDGGRDITGLPIDQFQRAVAADGDKRAALDELANATAKAAQDLKAACPSEMPLTAPGRLAAMQTRIEAMIAAVATVRTPLEKFYGLLSDEQKARITVLGQSRRSNASLLDQDCGPARPGMAEWPTTDIDKAVRPTEAQRASLTALQDAAAKATDTSKGDCPNESPLTPTARLAAVGKKLDALLQSIRTVSAPLNDFYGMLDDEQKARFDAISLPHGKEVDQTKAKPGHRRHYVSLGYLIRRFFRWY
jgi:LTXXQ motif family protein